MIQDDCAICQKFVTVIENLTDINNYILQFNPKSKKDFGLFSSAVTNQISELHRLQNYHLDYHARGDKDKNDLPRPESPVKFNKPRKWRPRFGS